MHKRTFHHPLGSIEEGVEHLRRSCSMLRNTDDLDPLMERIGDARYVLLGEASHGTHEYYAWRARITRRLIQEKGFSFIAVEGDWPDCYRLNRYVKAYPHAGPNARSVLHAFNRWPTWIWGNWEIVEFAEWLFAWNMDRSPDKRTGFYGLDVYSLWESMEAIVHYLRRTDPKTLKVAENVVRCFEPYREDEGQSYARAAALLPVSCEHDVVTMLAAIRQKLPSYNTDHEAVFSVEQNALVALNADRYYRSMFSGGAASWNIRDRHMNETLGRLMRFHGPDAKAIVWEHNTHIGDARATDMREDGMVNVGQLVQEEHADQGVVRVGFGSYNGSVIAGNHWGDAIRRMPVPPAPEGSWEHMLHQAGTGDELLLMHTLNNVAFFDQPIGHRAIGVVYDPSRERWGNYVPSVLPDRYEAFIHIDTTKALHPLHIKPDGHQIPQTYPWGV